MVSSGRKTVMTPDLAYASVAHSIAADRLSQAYVVAAPPRGEGTVFVKRVMSRLLCREADPPCGQCKRCVAVEKGSHPDVHWIEPQKKSRVIGIDQMRESFIPAIQRTSFEDGWKAGAIVGADCLNTAAANAFLKTLEEPPSRTVFFLLTDSPQRLLPTINSRCQHIAIDDPTGMQLDPEDQDELLRILSGETGVAGVAAAFGKADQLTAFMKIRKTQIEKEEKRDARDDSDEDVNKDTLEARIGARYREWRHRMLCAMLDWYRDVLMLTCGGDEQYLSFPDQRECLKAIASDCDYKQALAQVHAVEEMVVQLNRNLSESLVFGNAFFKLSV
jgi:DNA polymerase-3 subunit delta'